MTKITKQEETNNWPVSIDSINYISYVTQTISCYATVINSFLISTKL